MSSFKWLNNLLLLENFFGIYRTYSSQNNRRKYCIIIQIFIQATLYTISVIYQTYVFFGRNNIDQMKIIFISFSVSTYINCVSYIVTGVYYSHDFTSYLRSIRSVYNFFSRNLKDGSTLNKLIKTIVYTSISLTLITFLFSAYRSTEALRQSLPSDPVISLVPVMLPQVIMRMTVVFEYFMLHVVVMMVVLLIRCLNSLILATQKRVERNDSSWDKQCDITKKQIQEWVELYRDLVNCCKKVTLCFGPQYFYSLVLSISQNILSAYQVFCNYLSTEAFTSDGTRIIVTLFSYMVVMVMPLVGAQLTRNQGEKLHRLLVRLYNKMIIDSEKAEVKLIKDFIRLIKKNPLEINLSSKIRGGLYMLPIVFSLAVDHLIVMLQFNHFI